MPIRTPNLIHDLRSLPGAFWVLFAGSFINRFGSFVFPFLTILLGGRGVPLAGIALVLTGYGVGLLGATFCGGWFADRFGRRHTIVLGTLSNAAAVVALYFAAHPIVLALLTTAAGFAGGFYGPAVSALVADLVPQAERLTAFAALRLAGNSGFAFGTVAGAVLVRHDPFWLFAGDALTTTAFGALAWLALPHGLRQARGEARWSEALATLRKDHAFLSLAVAQVGVAFIFAQFVSAYALEVARRGLVLELGGWKLSPEQIYGLLIGWNGVMITALELPLTRWTGTLRPRRVMAAGYTLIGAGFALNIVDAGFGTLAVGMTIFTLGEMLAIPMTGPWVSHLAPAEMRGRYMGALAAAWAIGSILGQNVGLRLYAVSPAALWLLCAVLGGVSALVITFFVTGEASRAGKRAAPRGEKMTAR